MSFSRLVVLGGIQRLGRLSFKSEILQGCRVTSILPTSKAIQKRNISEEVMDEERSKQMSWMQWIRKKFNSELKEHVITEEERKRREDLFERVKECYYKKPPVDPDQSLYEEAFHILIDYKDRHSVNALWEMAQQYDFDFDDDLLDKIEDFMIEEEEKAWLE